jgi:Tc toxin complex TcA C-terminal TcB-binding domain/Neuraminidase-like domain
MSNSTSGTNQSFKITGTVSLADGSPAVGVKVLAFDRDLRTEEELGQSQTDKRGFYEIRYSSRQFLKAEKASADLLIKAFAIDGSLLASSPVLFNAPPSAEVDITIPAETRQPPSLFEKIEQTLKPLLNGLAMQELEEDTRHRDLTFLAGETGFNKAVLARFVIARKLVQRNLQAEFWFALLGGSFFEYTEDKSLKDQLAGILGDLRSLDAVAARKALVRSFNEKEIPETFQKRVTAWVEDFLKFIAQHTVSDSSEPTFVKSALEHAGIKNNKKQEKFARLLSEHKTLTPHLLTALKRDKSFKKSEIADLCASFQLADLTRADFSVVKAIKEGFKVRQPEKIRLLAKKSEAEWVKLVKAKHASGNIKLPIEVGKVPGRAKITEAEVYGKMLARQFREAFPTTAFAGGLERALRDGGAKGLSHAQDLRRFMDAHADFELLKTPVDDFLRSGIRPGFRSVAKNEGFRLELKGVQRVFKLAPSFEATDALLADNLHSAQQIYRIGKSEFVRRYTGTAGLTADNARLAWNRAADTHAAALTIVADLKALDVEGLPAVLKNNNAALSTFPNWNNLFTAGDLCECEHCRSVLSPAAYFADLVMFLRDRESTKPKSGGGFYSVKDILFDRRPDLGYLELNCNNALTPFPYIDTVCEVLEDAVDDAAENDLELAGLSAIGTPPTAADKAAVATAFENAFADPVNVGKEQIKLGADFSLSQVSPGDPDRWVVHGDDVAYLLKKKPPSPNFFAEVLRNTKASAAELQAYPQYVNPKAYEKLRAAKYPIALPLDLFPEGDTRRLEQRARSFALPFDLFAKEVRAGFQKCNLQRWDLMQTLRGITTPNNPSDGEIAAEYFGISVDPSAPLDEKRLILVADPTVAGQQAVWGEVGNVDWLAIVTNASDPKLANTLGNVKKFLQKTGLEYNELLALLNLKFINPDNDIAVHHLDPSCDTDKKVIQVLDPVKLDRIHRFLRLWRKLKDWKMWELDLGVRHPRIGNGALDEAFLVNLFYFNRLKNRLGGKTSVEQVCALFGDLNTETHFTKLYEKREDALYQSLFLNKRLINPIDPAFELDPGTGDLPTGDTISAHHPVLQAALGISEADLVLFKELNKPDGITPYITDDLTLSNLSFLWRHAWLSKLLKFKAEEWRTILKISEQDILNFANPEVAWNFVELIDQLKGAGFTPDELNWLLAADRSAKAAPKETDTARFLAALRKDLQAIQAEYDPKQYDFLTPTPPTDVDSLTALIMSLLQQLNRDEAAAESFIAILRDNVAQTVVVAGLPSGFDFPAAIKNAIAIRYDEPATRLRFTGLMTTSEQTTLLTDPSLAVVTGIAAYQEAIEDLFTRPRLEFKFYEPVFTAPLANLPAAVDFKTLSGPTLARKISYDAEQQLLRVAGILSQDEKIALDVLSTDPAYRSAVNALAAQPALIAPPDERIWLLDADLQFPLRDLNVPANDHLAENLATAATKALTYLSKTLSTNTVVRQSTAQLGLTEALTRDLFSDYAVLPDTLLAHLTGAFAVTSGVVDYATLKTTFDAWYWATRVAMMLKKWKLTLAEFEKIVALTAGAQLLDFGTLPLDDTAAIASIERFLRTSRLLRIRDSLPEAEITFLEVLDKLNTGKYTTAAEFAVDVHGLNDAWLADDMEALTTSLDLAYPTDYLLAEAWERLRRVFYFLDNLNAGANKIKIFAAAAMTFDEAKMLKELLRSKFGEETWLTLSAEIQDALRERKRDALTAYLLTQPQPANAPTGKWENTNDLYAYYLLDVEMTSCQLTSRLVQGSGSIQLFVQRCFMGLEPDVVVNVDSKDGDSAWQWWKWMCKYRVWEANRKVFLWPENWIEPELRPDRSSFFKDLENELLQNEINQDTVEKPFTNYLEKLDGVAQLEIAGFYQEDDGDNAIIHVFGRTKGAEPHLYYYRCYDYRQWAPWEKVDLDLQGDYLIPAVVNNRLFLFWPVFTEVPDEAANSTVSTPAANQSNVPVQKTVKRHRLQMAMSDYRQGKWTPKKISKDFYQSTWITVVDTVRKFYYFIPIDRSDIDGRFFIKFGGYSLGSDGYEQAELFGAFEIAGCRGTPELTSVLGNYKPVIQPEWASVGEYQNPDKSYTAFMKWVELGSQDEFGKLIYRHDLPENDFTLENLFATTAKSSRYTPVLLQTPWFFGMTPPWQLSYMDRLLLDGLSVIGLRGAARFESVAEFPTPIASWLPFFYNDKKRTFFVLPSLWQPPIEGSEGGWREYYPDIRKEFRQWEDYFAGQVQTWLDNFDLSTLTPAQRQQLEQLLYQRFPEEVLPPYTDEQVKNLMKRFLMRYFHFYLGAQSLQLFQTRQFHFKNFYHPFVCDFAKLVYNPLKGIPALMSRDTQLKESGFSFDQSYKPTNAVVKLPPEYPLVPDCYPREIVDFTPNGAYSSYNWELFFHAPLLTANWLSKNQRFEEARDWYHFIFNPIGVESPVPGGSAMSKYWITKPFFETTDPQYVQQRIDNILRMLAGDTSAPGYSAQAKKDLEDQVLDWRTHPFEPHRIANYRTVAYQKTAVMKYLDNLIAWGDYLFRQDSMESINEATQLYVLAAEILGPRPKKIPPQAKPPDESFNELEQEFDRFSNALVEVENLVPQLPGNGPDGADSAPLPMLYFCIPQNDKMLGYWDTVADRLYKIRHCMNIEGVVRQLALFEPPIEPGALVKAVAAGVDIASALADLNAPLPLYRFNVLLQKANEVCNDVKGLGSALLAALEKKDAEALGLLRQDQEIKLLEAVKAVKEHQIEEAQENLDGIKKSKVVAETRRDYYRDIERLTSQEQLHLDKLGEAHTKQEIAQGIKLGASIISLLPAIDLGASGFGGSPVAKFKIGGLELGQAASLASEVYSFLSQIAADDSAMASSKAGFDRRWDDWKLQERLAEREIDQLDSQIAAAELRVAIAEKDLENHVLQIENAKAVDEFMRSKYTNQELCQWQIGQIAGTFFQSYQLAYDLAKRAERCFRFELGLQDSNYIQFGYWDSLKKGLLSGEKLQYDLRRLEIAYLEQNKRKFELTKSISVLLLDPLALVKLRETGRCFISLPEEIFDLDYPGHYFRCIESVSITLPCVVGPYATISCTLRLLKNSIRINTANGDNGYPRNTDDQGLPADDDRFIENNIPVKAIAASHGQNDSGVFELSFRDERYLPFEGAGAVSDWSLELFNDLPGNNPDPGNPDFGKPLRQFDYTTISDAILHVKYTAREDAGPFKNGAITHLREYFSQGGTMPCMRMVNLRQELPSQWYRFLNPPNPANGNVFELEMSPGLFPFRDEKETLSVNSIWLLARCKDGENYTAVLNPPLASGSDTFNLAQVNQYGRLHFAHKDISTANVTIDLAAPSVKWRLKMANTNPTTADGNLENDPAEVEEVMLVLGYQWG